MRTTTTPDFDQLWDYNDPAATETRFRQVLPTLSVGSEAQVELLTQIARTLGLQRRFAEAHQQLDEAQALLQPGYARANIRYLLERGRTFNSSKQPEQARPLFLQAWEQALAAGEDGYAVDAAHMVAIVEPPAEKLAWEHKALAIAERSANPRAQRWLGSLYNNMGWSYHDLGQDEQALALFEKALAWRERQNQPVETRIARWSVARILRALQRVPEALAMQQQILQQLAESGESDGFVQEELGECLLALGQPDQARPYFARAYAELSQDPWLAENESARLERLKQLGLSAMI